MNSTTSISVTMKILSLMWNIAKSLPYKIPDIVVKVATIPYYRGYQFNTMKPMNKIAVLANHPRDDTIRLKAVASWRSRKLGELQFISISCAVLAAAVIGSFSWTNIEEAFWLTHGFWYGSLVLSILGILLSASEAAVLNLLGPLPHPKKRILAREALKRYDPLLLSNVDSKYIPRKKMVFTWQCPLMFMSYSVCGFLAGLTTLACTPLIRYEGDWSAGHNIAMMYLTICAIAGPLFSFCTFWVYHYVDLDFDLGDDEDDGNDPEGTIYQEPPVLPSLAQAASPSAYHQPIDLYEIMGDVNENLKGRRYT